jgi:hypothetical protein
MDEREQQRKVRHRLAVLRHAEEVTGNVAATAGTTGSAGSASTSGSTATTSWARRACEMGRALRCIPRTRPRPRSSARSST